MSHKTSKGYIITHIPNHPHAGKDGCVMQHRLVMEQELGRYLLPGEVVHHKNGIKNDNRIENLELTTNAQHTIEHHTGKKRGIETRLKISEKTKVRLSNKINHPSYKNIDITELKEAVIIGMQVKEICKFFGITRRTFHNKLAEFNLKEWYKSVKPGNFSRPHRQFD